MLNDCIVDDVYQFIYQVVEIVGIGEFILIFQKFCFGFCFFFIEKGFEQGDEVGLQFCGILDGLVVKVLQDGLRFQGWYGIIVYELLFGLLLEKVFV